MTWKEAIVTILQSAGGSLHYLEITRRILYGGLLSTEGVTPERTVSRILTKELLPGQEVIQTAPGTYLHASIPGYTVSVGDEQDDANGPDEIGSHEHWEGSRSWVEVNRYERDRSARQACIGHYGSKCVVCGFSFAERYGIIGADYIHVHHLVPLSSIGESYKIDPITDLRPICPNCHAMAHRRRPPYSVGEIQAMLT